MANLAAKHFINDPTYLVGQALRSLTYINPSVALDEDNKVIYLRPGQAPPQVSLVSGGGSGHEPSFSAFVGRGLLTGAVAGTIFASPSAEQVRNAMLHLVDGQKGVLVIVMNYTGDVLNFGMAVEKAKASGVRAEMVVVGDDVGVGRKKGGKVGRRGIAGTCLVQKIAGAMAATGAPLDQVHKVAVQVSSNLVSLGASLAHVHVPGRALVDTETEDLAADEAEVGMGIHNEPGSHRTKAELRGLVKGMLSQLLNQEDKDRAFLDIKSSDELVLLVNNLGGVSVLELGGITGEVLDQLRGDYGIKPVRVLSGTFMTSLNAPGFSISLLRVQDTGFGPGKSMLELLDAPAEASGWTAAVKRETWESQSSSTLKVNGDGHEIKASNLKMDPQLAEATLKKALNQLIAAEPEVTKFDTIAGDGDCGTGLKRGAEAILKLISDSPVTDDAVVQVSKIVQVVETVMDGTSGALYAIFLNSLAHGLRIQDTSSPSQATPAVWGKALQTAQASLRKYTPAQPGDRTLVDALQPFVETLVKTGDAKKAAEAAQKGAESTKGMKASLGRTVYVGGATWQDVPDPGAWGLSAFLTGLCEGL